MRRLYDLCGNVFLMVEHRRLKAAHIRKWKHANQNIVECKKIKTLNMNSTAVIRYINNG